MSSTRISRVIDNPSVAEQEIGEPNAALTVLPSSVIVVGAIREIRSMTPVTVAGIKITQSCNVLVVIYSIVSGLTILQPVRRGHLSDLTFIVPAHESIDRISIKGEANDWRVF
tara:strand:- start:615 stop:953 length:339 start_codon:yes stop_codon:yes gene_type:complete